MKILSIGSDRNLFIKDSEAQKRIKEYGKLFEELHIVVFTKKQTTNNKQQTIISDNIWVYSTNSRFKFFYIWDAYRIGKSLVAKRKALLNSDSLYALSDWRITCQDPFESGVAGWLLKKRFHLPLQLQVHTDIFSPYFAKESLLNRLRVLLAKFLLPRADSIRVVSERIKSSILRSCDDLNIEVLPIFVDVKKIQSAKIKTDLHKKYPEYDFIILMASRLTKEKNIDIAISAMKEVVKKHPKFLLLIVGDGLKKENLRTTAYGLRANIKFEPLTSDLISYYKTADLFLLTSNYEGYGRTVVEAMAAGLPVIMTDVGLAGELLIDDLDGRVVPIRDTKAFGEAIIELKENPAKREEFKQNSLKLLEKWPTKQEYLEKYKNLLLVLK